MSEIKNVIHALKILVYDLVAGDFEELRKTGRMGRLSEEEVKTALLDYGGSLSLPPDSAYESAGFRMRKLQNYPEYSIAFELWIDGEQSDLSLTAIATVNDIGEVLKIEMDDVHVL